MNPDQVKYVFPQPPGSYIAFNENLDVEPNSSKRLVKPMGISSPDTVEVVMRRLHRPYRADLWIKIITLAVSVGAIVVAIVFT